MAHAFFSLTADQLRAAVSYSRCSNANEASQECNVPAKQILRWSKGNKNFKAAVAELAKSDAFATAVGKNTIIYELSKILLDDSVGNSVRVKAAGTIAQVITRFAELEVDVATADDTIEDNRVINFVLPKEA